MKLASDAGRAGYPAAYETPDSSRYKRRLGGRLDRHRRCANPIDNAAGTARTDAACTGPTTKRDQRWNGHSESPKQSGSQSERAVSAARQQHRDNAARTYRRNDRRSIQRHVPAERKTPGDRSCDAAAAPRKRYVSDDDPKCKNLRSRLHSARNRRSRRQRRTAMRRRKHPHGRSPSETLTYTREARTKAPAQREGLLVSIALTRANAAAAFDRLPEASDCYGRPAVFGCAAGCYALQQLCLDRSPGPRSSGDDSRCTALVRSRSTGDRG